MNLTVKLLVIVVGAAGVSVRAADDPLPSWNDTAPKKAIIAFVDKVTKEGSVDFVPPAERIAAYEKLRPLPAAEAQTEGLVHNIVAAVPVAAIAMGREAANRYRAQAAVRAAGAVPSRSFSFSQTHRRTA